MRIQVKPDTNFTNLHEGAVKQPTRGGQTTISNCSGMALAFHVYGPTNPWQRS